MLLDFPWRCMLVSLLSLCVVGNAEAKAYESPVTCKTLECPSYDVLHHAKDLEIRCYKDTVWMATPPINTTSYTEAVSIGFKDLFAYIQGKNQQGVKIEMTAPVLTNIFPSTGPFCNSSFAVHFYVPKKFQKNPPLSSQVHRVKWPERRYAAVRRFGGFMDDVNIPMQAAELKKSIESTPWAYAVSDKGKSLPVYSVAGYNSPYEYENRVNEVMLLFDKY